MRKHSDKKNDARLLQQPDVEKKKPCGLGLFVCIIADMGRKGKRKMSKRKKNRDTVVWIIDTLVYLYVMYACLWTICHLVGEILEKMGVG